MLGILLAICYGKLAHKEDGEFMKILIGYDGSPSADAALDDLQRAGLPADVEQKF